MGSGFHTLGSWKLTFMMAPNSLEKGDPQSKTKIAAPTLRRKGASPREAGMETQSQTRTQRPLKPVVCSQCEKMAFNCYFQFGYLQNLPQPSSTFMWQLQSVGRQESRRKGLVSRPQSLGGVRYSYLTILFPLTTLPFTFFSFATVTLGVHQNRFSLNCSFQFKLKCFIMNILCRRLPEEGHFYAWDRPKRWSKGQGRFVSLLLFWEPQLPLAASDTLQPCMDRYRYASLSPSTGPKLSWGYDRQSGSSLAL